ncbi:hypothetical protein INT47_013233 [Mucor saturninus]|uniref:Late endosomal/lysosomal adaptor and MAPK and MTOR activator 1 n=1 Tax=Mucor saturninus TaxID=64648 RepID=A0A8H7V2G1_9FUNG|nr:hypothetical protein INT47_013233 [Mucor saturninus]
MGCCGSKEDHEDDGIRDPLLEDFDVDNRRNYRTQEPINIQKEQEFWSSIIDRTTQNLIDISSAQTDPLQDTDVEERENKYRQLVEGTQPRLLTHPTLDNNTNIWELLSQAKPNGGMTDGEVDWLYQTMDEIQDALQHIVIEPAGEMVVHLTMTENSSIKAY